MTAVSHFRSCETLALDSKKWSSSCVDKLIFAAELDGHVLGTLCAVTMALLTNRLDLCIQGLFGRQVQIDGSPHPGLD